MAKLNGAQRRELVAALVDAFPSYDALDRMVSFGLDERLERIAGLARLDAVAFSLVRWAEARGLLGALVEAARNANPGNPTLRAFLEETWAAVPPAADPPVS